MFPSVHPYLMSNKLIYCFLLSALACTPADHPIAEIEKRLSWDQGAIIRGDTTQKRLAFVFTGHEFADGGSHIQAVLQKHKVPGSFFLTGDFYRNPDFKALIQGLAKDGHYLGAHSDRHLLYCDWEKRDSLLLTKTEFLTDLEANYQEMARFGIQREEAFYYLPPYEWYNDSISQWTIEAGFQLINITYGTRSHADYTTPGMPNYISSQAIFQSIIDYESGHSNGLNGFILLIHIGTAPARSDKFYFLLEELILYLKKKGYQMEGVDEFFR